MHKGSFGSPSAGPAKPEHVEGKPQRFLKFVNPHASGVRAFRATNALRLYAAIGQGLARQE
jgi:hypothetical protein